MRFFGVVHANGGIVTVVEDTVCGERIISKVIRDNISEISAKRLVAKLTKLDDEAFKVTPLRCQNCGAYSADESCVTYEDDENPFGKIPVYGDHNFQTEN